MTGIFSLTEVTPNSIGRSQQEFGSSEDVRRCFGIKKGTLYNLQKFKKVRSISVPVTGKSKGVRLWDFQSIRNYINTYDSVNHP